MLSLTQAGQSSVTQLSVERTEQFLISPHYPPLMVTIYPPNVGKVTSKLQASFSILQERNAYEVRFIAFIIQT